MKKRLTPYRAYCARLRKEQLLRCLPKEREYQYDFSSNDYLGFSQHPVLINAAKLALEQQGIGSTGSRLITLKQKAINDLERDIAASKGTETAMIFATGYQANLSLLSSLLDSKILGAPPLVFADKLNHASMHAGCKLARVKQLRYQHADYDHLAWLLAKTASQKQPRFILTESVFGMDGDCADLAAIIRLARQYEALIYVDEAHATGLFGPQGYGLSTDFPGEIDIVMGTFSKALGGSGAYAALSRTLKRYFINRSGGFIFSTAPSPMQIAAMHAAWQAVPMAQNAAQQLKQSSMQLRADLKAMGYNTGLSTTHIIPLILHSPQQTLALQQFLAQQHIRVSAIRPPSIPLKQSRIRLALNTTHTLTAIEALKNNLKKYTQSSRFLGEAASE